MGIVGAIIFGVVVGYLTYRTMVRAAQQTAISDLAVVIAVIGGGAVTQPFDPTGDRFGWYTVGLAAAMALLLVLHRATKGRQPKAAVTGTGITALGDDGGDSGTSVGNPPGVGAGGGDSGTHHQDPDRR